MKRRYKGNCFVIFFIVVFLGLIDIDVSLANENTLSEETQGQAEEWIAMVTGLEQELAEGKVTEAKLFNLAVLYGKLGDYPQSMMFWLRYGQWHGFDESFLQGYQLVSSQVPSFTASSLFEHLGALRFVAQTSDTDFFRATILVQGIVWIFCPFCFFLARMALRRMIISRQIFEAVVTVGLSLSIFSVGTLSWGLYQRGVWSAVVSLEPVGVYEDEALTREIRSLQPGTPVYVTGDTFAQKGHVLLPSGHRGYMDYSGLRMIR